MEDWEGVVGVVMSADGGQLEGKEGNGEVYILKRGKRVKEKGVTRVRCERVRGEGGRK